MSWKRFSAGVTRAAALAGAGCVAAGLLGVGSPAAFATGTSSSSSSTTTTAPKPVVSTRSLTCTRWIITVSNDPGGNLSGSYTDPPDLPGSFAREGDLSVFSFDVSSLSGTKVKFTFAYSPDGGKTWQNLTDTATVPSCSTTTTTSPTSTATTTSPTTSTTTTTSPTSTATTTSPTSTATTTSPTSTATTTATPTATPTSTGTSTTTTANASSVSETQSRPMTSDELKACKTSTGTPASRGGAGASPDLPDEVNVQSQQPGNGFAAWLAFMFVFGAGALVVKMRARERSI